MEIGKVGRVIVFLAIMALLCVIYVDSVNREECKLDKEMREIEIKGYEKGWNDHMNMTFNILTNLENGNATILNSSDSNYDSCKVLGLNKTVVVVAEKRSNSYRLYAFGISNR